MAANGTRRIELVADDDPRFVLLKVHRNVLLLILLVLVLMASVFTFGILQNARTDDHIVKEAEHANLVSQASVRFWRCAFLIEPDVEKSPAVIDKCIKEANFPKDVEAGANGP